MTRAELIRLFALNSICDDYEDIERITISINRDSRDCGMTISDDEIIKALRELIDLGLAKAWRLYWTREPPRKYEGMPLLQDIKPHGAYFYITPAGMDFHLAPHPGWPFNDDRDLLNDWTAPNA